MHKEHEYEGLKVLCQIHCDLAMLSDLFFPLEYKTYDVIKIYLKKILINLRIVVVER
jgi:hypothetical protein